MTAASSTVRSVHSAVTGTTPTAGDLMARTAAFAAQVTALKRDLHESFD
jgi:hypothetical protein